jgi:hydrogenase maturation protein HypF
MHRRRIRVRGIVQGVGFRPHVHAVATALGLAGWVGNDADGVLVEVEGPAPAVDRFEELLRTEPPPLAVVDEVVVEPLEPTGAVGFVIAVSDAAGRRTTLVPPDVAACDACLAEVDDPADRRHGYALTNCTDCGPRYTIVRDVPYDRPATTMAAFPMCALCAAEYHDPTDRRFHAQPVACPACGPRLRLVPLRGGDVAVDATARPGDLAVVERTVALLTDGWVVAVKGVGGFHLAVRADDEDAVATLRRRKRREEKPFAVMVADLDAARALCVVDAAEAALLGDRSRPIVLLRRRTDAAAAPAVAPAVAPGSHELGLFLPYTPLHHLLLSRLGLPLVLTSGNVSDEPIVHRDEDAEARLAPVADALLTHDRPIHVRVDDSVARVVEGDPVLLRRSRGHVPRPVRLPVAATVPVLAVGAELKSTVCVARGADAVLSHHLGDLRTWEVSVAFRDAVAHLERLMDVRPQVVAHDLHPQYLSTVFATERDDARLVGVQHHHAHVASCLAEHGRGVGSPVLGVALDGTGWGPDGTIWGGELLLADLRSGVRVGHLSTVPMPGGDAAVREPWRMAVAHLLDAEGTVHDDLALVRRHDDRVAAVAAVARTPRHAPVTSSAGRLFDAVAALLDVRDTVSYEGQAAIELEQLAATVAGGDPGDVAGAHGHRVSGQGTAEDPLVIDRAHAVRAVLRDVRAGEAPAVVAARFHVGLAAGLVDAATRLCDQHGVGTVALSGGVFQNVVLLRAVSAGLVDAGLEVLRHRRVPPNDGGIALGQAAVAAARDADGLVP